MSASKEVTSGFLCGVAETAEWADDIGVRSALTAWGVPLDQFETKSELRDHLKAIGGEDYDIERIVDTLADWKD